MKSFLSSLALLLILVNVNVFAKHHSEYKSFDKEVQVVDVRSDSEWEDGHHPDAKHIPHSLILDGKGIDGLDKDKPVVLYCRSGGRAERAKNYLEANGFTNVTNAGGISDLVLPKEKK